MTKLGPILSGIQTKSGPFQKENLTLLNNFLVVTDSFKGFTDLGAIWIGIILFQESLFTYITQVCQNFKLSVTTRNLLSYVIFTFWNCPEMV